jgi:hypothetical protein
MRGVCRGSPSRPRSEQRSNLVSGGAERMLTASRLEHRPGPTIDTLIRFVDNHSFDGLGSGHKRCKNLTAVIRIN